MDFGRNSNNTLGLFKKSMKVKGMFRGLVVGLFCLVCFFVSPYGVLIRVATIVLKRRWGKVLVPTLIVISPYLHCIVFGRYYWEFSLLKGSEILVIFEQGFNYLCNVLIVYGGYVLTERERGPQVRRGVRRGAPIRSRVK